MELSIRPAECSPKETTERKKTGFWTSLVSSSHKAYRFDIFHIALTKIFTPLDFLSCQHLNVRWLGLHTSYCRGFRSYRFPRMIINDQPMDRLWAGVMNVTGRWSTRSVSIMLFISTVGLSIWNSLFLGICFRSLNWDFPSPSGLSA